MLDGRGLGPALIRDCNSARAFDTLLRYRGGTLAELWRALRTLKTLQTDQVPAPQAEPTASPEPRSVSAPRELPTEPEGRANPREITCAPTTGKAVATLAPAALAEEPPAHCGKPIEPQARGNPGGIAPAAAAASGGGGSRDG